MWRHIASNAVTFLLVGLFLLGGIILWGKTTYVSEGPLEQVAPRATCWLNNGVCFKVIAASGRMVNLYHAIQLCCQPHKKLHASLARIALAVLAISIAIVSGPTPPGTGVIAFTFPNASA